MDRALGFGLVLVVFVASCSGRGPTSSPSSVAATRLIASCDLVCPSPPQDGFVWPGSQTAYRIDYACPITEPDWVTFLTETAKSVIDQALKTSSAVTVVCALGRTGVYRTQAIILVGLNGPVPLVLMEPQEGPLFPIGVPILNFPTSIDKSCSQSALIRDSLLKSHVGDLLWRDSPQRLANTYRCLAETERQVR